MGIGMIFGLAPSDPLPENVIPVDAIAVIKCLEDGKPVIFIRSTESLTDVEALGFLTAAQATQQKWVVENFGEEDEA